ncbi:lipase family protein [Nocardia sp. NPDC049149]|uniref:lipase family protein n=1 Tax=Nocardia sp. NPDC049149 TaxID=3364315 RepID=UPI00371716DA
MITGTALADPAPSGSGQDGSQPAWPTRPGENQFPRLPSETDIYPFIPVPLPTDDPWYADPADLDNLANGDVIRKRVVTTYLLAVPWPPVHTEQILYRSTDSRDHPIATATTVLIPGIPWLGPGTRPVISYQEAIDSLDPACNPSHTLRAGTMKETQLLLQFLGEGMAVSVPDFNGKTNTTLAPSEGRMVLDGVRAVRRAGIGMDNSAVGLWGYSGGGSATAWAAELHRSYAPDLPIKGSAQGGVPGDKHAMTQFAMDAGPGIAGQADFIGWIWLIGLSREYPDLLPLDKFLTADGMTVAHDIERRCLYTAAATGAWRPLKNYLKDQNAFLDPDVQNVLHRDSLGYADTPDIPVSMWASTTDPIVPIASIEPVVKSYCAAGANLRFFRVPATEHISAELVGYEPSLLWLTAVLAGADPGPTTC